MASNTSSAFLSPSSMDLIITGTSVVPKWAVSPARPEIRFFNSSLVNCPLKQRSMSWPAGSVPARSGEKGPSPSNALFASIARPWRWTAIEIPPPKWQMIKSRSSYCVPCSLAKRRAIAFWFKACQIVILGINGEPVIRAISSSSSTTPGSAMKARQLGKEEASLSAINPPRLQAWVRMACTVSRFMASFTSYTPPGIGFTSPPRPMTASKSKGILLASNSWSTRFFRNSNWSTTCE